MAGTVILIFAHLLTEQRELFIMTAGCQKVVNHQNPLATGDPHADFLGLYKDLKVGGPRSTSCNICLRVLFRIPGSAHWAKRKTRGVRAIYIFCPQGFEV